MYAPTGRFYKKINGKRYYFGKMSDGWQKALDLYQQQRDDLHAGQIPRATHDGLRLHELVNRCLDAKQRMREGGELQHRTWRDCFATCRKLTEFIGRDCLVEDLTADDFGRFRLLLTKAGLGPVAIDNGVISKLPLYGTGFKRPSVRTLWLD